MTLLSNIEATAQAAPMLAGRPIRFQPIRAGLTNINWKATDAAAGTTYFVKQYGPGTDAFIDRSASVDASSKVSRLGLAPAVLYASDNAGLEVQEFLIGFESCTIQDCHGSSIQENILKAYKLVHDNCHFIHTNTGLEQIDLFEHKARSGRELSKLPRLLLDAAAHGRAAIVAAGMDLTGCFNDGYVQNYMKNGAGVVRMVDWEYASNNDPYWDIALFAGEIYFETPKLIELLLEMYEGSASKACVARTYIYAGLAMIRWALWAIHQDDVSTIDFDYGKYADTLLLRARHHIERDDWAWALRYV